MALFVRPKGGL